MVERRGGRVVNIGSLAGSRDELHLGLCLRQDGLPAADRPPGRRDGRAGVTVFCVSPGLVRIAAGDADPLSGRFLHAEEDLDELLADAARIAADDLLTLRLREWPGG
jgi:hypothetical protein